MKRHANPVLSPVGCAVARKRLQSVILDAKISIYMRDQAEECSDLLDGIESCLSLIGYAHEWQHRSSTEDVRNSLDLRILRGGLSACNEMRGVYNKKDTIALDKALDAAMRLNTKLKPESMMQAWINLRVTG